MTPISIFSAHAPAHAVAMATTIHGFGERLSAALVEKGISQGELSRRARIRPETVSRYVSGQTPRLPELLAIADVLECSIDWLIRGEVSAPDEETAASIAWAIAETKLDARGAFMLREVCRRIGSMERDDVYVAASRIAANAARPKVLSVADSRR